MALVSSIDWASGVDGGDCVRAPATFEAEQASRCFNEFLEIIECPADIPAPATLSATPYAGDRDPLDRVSTNLYTDFMASMPGAAYIHEGTVVFVNFYGCHLGSKTGVIALPLGPAWQRVDIWSVTDSVYPLDNAELLAEYHSRLQRFSLLRPMQPGPTTRDPLSAIARFQGTTASKRVRRC